MTTLGYHGITPIPHSCLQVNARWIHAAHVHIDMVADDATSLPDDICIYIKNEPTCFTAVRISVDALRGAYMERAIYQFVDKDVRINGTDKIVVSMCRGCNVECRHNLLAELSAIQALAEMKHCESLQSVVVQSVTVYRSGTNGQECITNHMIIQSDGLILYEAYDYDVVTWIDGMVCNSFGPQQLVHIHTMLDTIARQLACMYANGLLYVDIKPDNIVVKQLADDRYAFMLCDLGSVLPTSNNMVYGKGMQFSPSYVCYPRLGAQIDALVYAEIVAYALGVLFHTLFNEQILKYEYTKQIVWMSTSKDGVYARVLAIVQRTLHIKPKVTTGA